MDVSPTLNIQLLGYFHLVFGNEAITGVKTARLQSLLAYLILHRNLPQPRQRLAFLFWPDTSEEQARNNLRNLLHFLRRALPDSENFLLVNTQTIQWNPPSTYMLDVDRFTYSAAQSESKEELQKAIQLYSGDLLPDCYDDWIQPERENLRQLFITALEKLIQLLEDEHDYPLAILYAQRMVQVEPLSEVAHHRLMRLYAANGDRTKAVHAYHTCVTLFERELGVEPGSEIQIAYQRLLKVKEFPPIPRLAGTPPLIGRGREWAILQSTWRKVVPGQAFFVLITGEVGIGKTRLAEEMMNWAERQGIPTAIARCFAIERGLSYAPITAWLRSRTLPALEEFWLSEVGRLLPEVLTEHPGVPNPTPLTENWQRLRLFKALALALLKGSSDLILLIEDLQWCDPDTIQWIGYLLQTQEDLITGTRLLVIGTQRPGEIAADYPMEILLADLRHAKRMFEIELGSLSESETGILAGAIAGEEIDSPWRDRFYQETEGNPLFIVEMARLFREKELENRQYHIALLPKIQEVIQSRLQGLTPTAYELVEIAAVIGRQFTFPVLKQAARREEGELVNSLDELWRRRIVREQGREAYDFSHDKIRELVYVSMSSARRKLLHHRIAEALEFLYSNELDVFSGQIAFQYDQAGIIEPAVEWYRRAAKISRSIYANQTAIDFYRQALALLQEDHPSQDFPAQSPRLICAINEDLGDILSHLRQLDEARDAYEKALVLVTADHSLLRAHIYRKIGRIAADLNEANRIFQVCEEILNTLIDENNPEWWHEAIELISDRIENDHRQGRLAEIIERIQKMQPIIESRGTPSQRFHYFINIALKDDLIELLGASNQSVSTLQAAKLAAKESGNIIDIALARFHLGTFQTFRDEYENAERELQEALTLTVQTGDLMLKARCLCSLTFLNRRQGLVDEVQRYVSLAMEASTAARSPYHIAVSRANAAWIAWRKEKLDECRQQALMALAEPIFAAEQMVWAALWPLVGAYVANNQMAEAIQYTRRIFSCKY